METVFYQKMKFLCAQKDIEISNVLKAVGLSTSKGTAWKDGAIPKGDVLLVLANYFNVSTDYLLGNTDDPAPAGQKGGPPQGGEPPTIEDWEKAFEGKSKEELKEIMEIVMKKFMETN